MKKIRMKINTKMLVFILGGATIVYIISLGSVFYQTFIITEKDTYTVVEKTAEKYANEIKAGIDADFQAVRTLAQIGQTYNIDRFSEWEEIYLAQEKEIIKANEHFLSVATSFELSAIDTNYTNPYGRSLKGFFRDNDNIRFFDLQKDLDGIDPKSNYYKIKSEEIEWLSNPELYSYTGNEKDTYLNCNISTPIMIDNEYKGLAGIDLNLTRFQILADSIKPYNESFAFILSNDGTFVAHPNTLNIGQKITVIDSALVADELIEDKIKKGLRFSFERTDTITNEIFYYTFAPIKVKNLDTYWSLAIATPKKIIREKTSKVFQVGFLIGGLGLIIMAFLVLLIARNISRPIQKATKKLKELSQGVIDTENTLNISTKDEMGDMAESLNTLTMGLSHTAKFATDVGKGNLDIEFTKLSDNDMLGSALLDMRNDLKSANEENQKRKKEEDIRRWVTDGHSLLNDLLRQSKNLADLSYDILKETIKYIDAAMGGLYILNDENKNDLYFEMIATVAYERKKLNRDKVQYQQGLIGRCAHEKLTIHLREIPENYIKISSGLGDSKPRSLLVIPLKVNEEVMGVIELVSFNLYEDYQIEFLEKAGESIASQINTAKINERTEKLLKKSQEQADELAQQEEEMRQNMEEIQATQESLRESQARTQMIFDNIDDAIITIDNLGIVELYNPAAEQLFGYSAKEIIGNNVKMLMYGDDARDHDNYIKRYVDTGQRHVIGMAREMKAMHKTGRIIPIELRLEEGRLGNEVKFIGVIRNIEDRLKQQKDYRKKIEELNIANEDSQKREAELLKLIEGVKEVALYAEYNMEREIIDINENFTKLLSTTKEEMLGVKQGAFETDDEKKKEFHNLWRKLRQGKTSRMVQHISAQGKNLWFSEVYIPIKDKAGNVSRVINLAIDITDSIKKH